MELTLRRRRRINEALFDYFVAKYILPTEGIISEEGVIDTRFLNGLAEQLGKCNSHALRLSIQASCARMTGLSTKKIVPKEEEEKVMWAAAKFRITNSKQPLKNYKRGFGNLAAELRKQNPRARITTEQLLQFAYPIYLEVIEEMFNSSESR